MIPGVSRAGATIMGALMLRVDRAPATQFSFFLAIPTMLGASVYDLYKNRAIITTDGAALIAVGFVVAFIAALFVVRRLVDFVSRHGFGVFAWYRIVVGAIGGDRRRVVGAGLRPVAAAGGAAGQQQHDAGDAEAEGACHWRGSRSRRRASRRARIAHFSAALASYQARISSTVRRQPRHMRVAGSIRQMPRQGEAG